jgi:hypothetical protein
VRRKILAVVILLRARAAASRTTASIILYQLGSAIDLALPHSQKNIDRGNS